MTMQKFYDLKVDSDLLEHIMRGLGARRPILLLGPAGVGKIMLVRRLAEHVSEGPQAVLRAPHHTCSEAGIFGSTHHNRPGEVTLADGGLLFLDEMPEFRRRILQTLRGVWERRCYEAKFGLYWPADFVLVGSSTHCPCGTWGRVWADGSPKKCDCTMEKMEAYRERLINAFGYMWQVTVGPGDVVIA